MDIFKLSPTDPRTMRYHWPPDWERKFGFEPFVEFAVRPDGLLVRFCNNKVVICEALCLQGPELFPSWEVKVAEGYGLTNPEEST